MKLNLSIKLLSNKKHGEKEKRKRKLIFKNKITSTTSWLVYMKVLNRGIKDVLLEQGQ